MLNMNNQLIHLRNIEEIPAKYDERSCTDVLCAIIGVLFSASLFLTAFVTYNGETYLRSNFPTDSVGKICGLDDDVKGYPYVYFANLPSFSRRLCVSQCPKKGDDILKCVPASDDIGCGFTTQEGFQVTYYDNNPKVEQNGNFCFPADETAYNKLLVDTKLRQRGIIIDSISSVLICLFIALGLSIIFLVLVQFFPYYMVKIAVIGGFFMMIVLCICMVAYSTVFQTSKWLVFIVFLLATVLVGLTIWTNRYGIRIFSFLLESSTQFVREKIYVIAYIPLFIVVTTVFMIFLVLQFKSFWAGGKLTFDTNKSIFYQILGAGPSALTFFWVVQVVWGLSFIKEAFNFCVSGMASQWYFHKDDGYFQPLKLLFMKHLGSVIACSFLSGFFMIGDFMFDLIKSNTEDEPNTCKYKFNKFCSPIFNFFDLVRSDSMAYVYLCGTAYCPSARYCQYLCQSSLVTQSNQSTSRAYRICSHIFVAGLVGLLALYIKGSTSLMVVVVIFFLSIFISTFFITLHADAAEAIQINILFEEEFNKRERQQTSKQSGKRKFDRFSLDEAFDIRKRESLSKDIKEAKLQQNRDKNDPNLPWYSWITNKHY